MGMGWRKLLDVKSNRFDYMEDYCCPRTLKGQSLKYEKSQQLGPQCDFHTYHIFFWSNHLPR